MSINEAQEARELMRTRETRTPRRGKGNQGSLRELSKLKQAAAMPEGSSKCAIMAFYTLSKVNSNLFARFLLASRKRTNEP